LCDTPPQDRSRRRRTNKKVTTVVTRPIGGYKLSPLTVDQADHIAGCIAPLSDRDTKHVHVRSLNSAAQDPIADTDNSTETNQNQNSEQLPTVELPPTDLELRQIQLASNDLADMIYYLERGVLPTDENAAKRIVCDAPNWTVLDGVLFHLYNPRKRNVNSVKPIILQLAIPYSLRPRVLTAYHENCGHWRAEKMYATLQQRFYWCNMYAAVRNHLSKCLQCAVAKQQPPRKSLLQHAPQHEPFECLIIDHISLPPAVDPLTGQSVQYGLTMVDHSTNWIECVPVPDVSAKTSARAIYTHWIARYGWPRKLRSDLSTSFTSNLFVELCKLGGIDHSFA